ncbi:MAG: cyclic nucleotide-binding domain-containing protein [Betaproteobacteria bacterium]|nr:cyclic nucleotide-binding domain-containing protein [Betaproteobacteria bacterium]MBI2509924.1 cyclic nucleotide-binding domain-containing protein [Betaproteobacteria bacterium]
MEDLDFTRPARSEVYKPDVARAFFESAGKPESVARGGILLSENQQGGKMYYLLEGEIGLARAGKTIDIVKAGEIIGEMAVVSQLPRTATAVARAPCRVIALEAGQFKGAIQKMPEFALMLLNIIINRLRLTIARLAVTGALPDGEMSRESAVFDAAFLARLRQELDREPAHNPLNKVIMREGEAGIFMYIVAEGRVAVSIKGKVVERVGPGGVFGEMALVDQSPRAATATAETDCYLLTVNRNDFLALVKSRPEFGVTLLKSVAERMRHLTAR